MVSPLTFELLEVSAKRRLSHTLSRGWESCPICSPPGKAAPKPLMKFLSCLSTFNINIFPISTTQLWFQQSTFPLWQMLTSDMISLGKQLLKNQQLKNEDNWLFWAVFFSLRCLPCPGGKHSVIKITCACVLGRFSRVQLFATMWTAAHQAPQSMGFSRQEYWSGVPLPSPGKLNSKVQVLCLYSTVLWACHHWAKRGGFKLTVSPLLPTWQAKHLSPRLKFHKC